MGTHCELNSILKLSPSQGFPEHLVVSSDLIGVKEGYRIYPLDVPLFLLNEHWYVCGVVTINRMVWQSNCTELGFQVVEVYSSPYLYPQVS